MLMTNSLPEIDKYSTLTKWQNDTLQNYTPCKKMSEGYFLWAE